MHPFLVRTEELCIQIQGDRYKTWLAKKAGLNPSTVRGWFSNGGLPNIEDAKKIADALNTSVQYLLYGEGPLHTDKNDIISKICNAITELSPADQHRVYADIVERKSDTQKKREDASTLQ